MDVNHKNLDYLSAFSALNRLTQPGSAGKLKPSDDVTLIAEPGGNQFTSALPYAFSLDTW